VSKKILVACRVPESSLSLIRGLTHEIVVYEDRLPPDMREFDAVLIRGNVKADGNFLSRLKKGSVLIRLGVGTDNVDLKAAKELGVKVCNTPCSSSESVAEHALGITLALAKRIPRCDREIKSGGWPKSSYDGLELRGKTLGIIGFGCTGKEVARLGQAFGMKILAYDKYKLVNEKIKADYRDLLSKSDFISFHVPLTEETKGMLDVQQLPLLKRGVFIINVSRGEVVSIPALLEGLDKGIIAGVGLDVVSHEPPETSEEKRLVSDPRVIVTPHVAGSTEEAEEQAVRMACSTLQKLWSEENDDDASLS